MMCASLALAALYFILAVHTPIAFSVMLVMIGMAKGIIYPAIAMHLSGQTNEGHLGRVFAYLSVSYSLGAFLGPLIAAQTRTFISPYFTAFLLLGAAVLWLSATFDNCQRAAYQG